MSPIPTFTGMGPYPDFNDVVKKINTIVGELTNLMLNLDTLNVVSLNAEVIEAGTITADKIQSGSITSDKIQAGSITAEKMNVTQLSAISANLGTIIAGLINGIQIFGSYIATSNGTYPRAEMSVANESFAVYYDVLNYIRIIADFIGSPRMDFKTTGVTGQLFAASSTFVVNASAGRLQLSGLDVKLLTAGTGQVLVQNWGKFQNEDTGQTLQQALDALSARITALGG